MSRLQPAVAMACALALAAGQAGCQQLPDRASATAGASVTGPRNASGSRGEQNCAIDDSLDFGPNHGYAWAWLDTPTVITLGEPAVIDTVEILFADTGGRTFSYRLSVGDEDGWRVVADATDERVSGYRMHRFEATRATRLRLQVTDTSLPVRSYHVVEIDARRLGEQARAGPLGRRWARVREERRTANVALLGVDAAQQALADPEVADRAAALPEGGRFVQELADGTRALLTRDAGHLIVAIDDDDDMPPDATEPDEDSDCLAIDMDRDGVLDRTIDYADTDGDGVADRMTQTYTDRNTWGSRPFLVVIRDLDRGPLSLWALHDYGYVQSRCQWECDFAGDGWFCMFRRARDGDRWVAALEAPFCFYDPDGDGLPEETVRLTATDTRLHSARYGINADNDRTEGQLYDYDASVTCLGSVQVPEDARVSFEHRSGDRAGPFLRWEDAREVVRSAAWDRALFIWDENDHNVASRAPDHERWEGIINLRYRGFPQEGGPPTMRLNKRFELDADFSGRMRLYWWRADGRLHLHGAEQGSLDVDFDDDGRVDLSWEYVDTDGDGFFDRRTVSAPGLPDRRIDGPRVYAPPGRPPPAQPRTLPYAYADVAPAWTKVMTRWSANAEELLDAIEAAAQALGVRPHTAPMDVYRTATVAEVPAIERYRASAEALRFYRDVAVALGLAHLARDAGAAGAPDDHRQRIDAALHLADGGDLRAAAVVLRGLAGDVED